MQATMTKMTAAPTRTVVNTGFWPLFPCPTNVIQDITIASSSVVVLPAARSRSLFCSRSAPPDSVRSGQTALNAWKSTANSQPAAIPPYPVMFRKKESGSKSVPRAAI